jgi:hypothetical protein
MRNSPSLVGLALTALWLMLLSATLPAAADDPRQLPHFETPHYTVYSDLERRDAERFALHLERFHVVYTELLSSIPGKPRGRQDVYLFGSHDAYIDGLEVLGVQRSSAETSGGMFFRRADGGGLAAWIDARFMRRDEDGLRRTLQHEGFHQFAAAKSRVELPRWVNEGLAEYFEVVELEGRNFERGQVPAQSLAELRGARAEDRLIPFEDLLKLTGEQWWKNMGTPTGFVQYRQSWLTVHFLLHGHGGRYKKLLGEYLRLMAEGHESEAAFERAFKTGDVHRFGVAVAEYLDDLKASR